MICCRVVGTIGAQQKDVSLAGKKLLLCEQNIAGGSAHFVAADLVGAGCGDKVLVSNSLVNVSERGRTEWIDQWIVGIIDDEDAVQLQKEGIV